MGQAKRKREALAAAGLLPSALPPRPRLLQVAPPASPVPRHDRAPRRLGWGARPDPEAVVARELEVVRWWVAERQDAEREIRKSVAVLRAQRVTWAKIASALGVTAQSAQERYGR